LRFAHALDLRVVAEGIERAEQLNELIGLECEQVQGFAIQAVDADTATSMVQDKWTATLSTASVF
jgi:EAL domain-containing protein (putative c-di-GMP-specific phosphodiesterase class I)